MTVPPTLLEPARPNAPPTYQLALKTFIATADSGEWLWFGCAGGSVRETVIAPDNGQVMTVRIGKIQIVEMFRMRGQHERASEVDSSLPDVVDTRADAELLGRHGLDPREMVNRLPDTGETTSPPERRP